MLIERGGADAAGRPEFGERPGLSALREGCGDALIDGSWCGGTLQLTIGLDEFEGESIVALGELEGDGLHRGGGTMFDGEDDAVVAVAAQVEVGVAPGVEFGRASQGLPVRRLVRPRAARNCRTVA